jgi:hypothetical protein
MVVLRLGRLSRTVAIGVATAIALGGAYLEFLQVTGNFNTIISGELYRSGQFSQRQLDDYVSKYGIKTVINLRGSNPGTPWYEAETAESRKLHINHVDFGLSARREVNSRQTSELIALLRNAAAGFTAGVAMPAVWHRDRAHAQGAITLKLGHPDTALHPNQTGQLNSPSWWLQGQRARFASRYFQAVSSAARSTSFRACKPASLATKFG